MPLLGAHSSWCRKGWKGVCVEECVSLERPTALLRSQRPHPPGCPASQRWLPPSGWGDTPHPRRNTPAEPTLCTRTRVCSCRSRSRCTLSRSSQRPAPHTCAHGAELAGSRSGTPRGSSAPGQAFQVPPEGLDLCLWWVAGCTRTPNSPGSHPRLGHGFLCPPHHCAGCVVQHVCHCAKGTCTYRGGAIGGLAAACGRPDGSPM